MLREPAEHLLLYIHVGFGQDLPPILLYLPGQRAGAAIGVVHGHIP